MPEMNEVSINKSDLIRKLQTYKILPEEITGDLKNIEADKLPVAWEANPERKALKDNMHQQIHDAMQKRTAAPIGSALYTPLATKSHDHRIDVSTGDIKKMLENYLEIKDKKERESKISTDIKALEQGATSVKDFFEKHGLVHEARNIL